MRSLRPIALLWLGPLALGCALAAGGAITVPGMRTPQAMLINLALGLGLGALMFGPAAAAQSLGAEIARMLGPRAYRVQMWAALLLAASLGYLCASVRHLVFDWLTAVACLVVFVAASIGANGRSE